MPAVLRVPYGAGEHQRKPDAEDEKHRVEHTEEDGLVGLPQGQIPGEGAMSVFTMNKHEDSLNG